jgi:hypothetical protein
MFPPTPQTIRPARSSWRDAVRVAADRAVAFVTLESYSLASPHAAVAEPAPHPHREPLRHPRRVRRPGEAAPRAQHCVTPLSARPRRATSAHSMR